MPSAMSHVQRLSSRGKAELFHEVPFGNVKSYSTILFLLIFFVFRTHLSFLSRWFEVYDFLLANASDDLISIAILVNISLSKINQLGLI